MTRIGIAATLLLAAGTSLSAQQVRVRVVDDAGRQPLAGVRVAITDTAATEYAAAETDDDGFAAFEQVGAGAWMLVIEHMGYAPVRQPLTVTGEGPLDVPAIPLKSVAIVLDTLEAMGRIHDDLRGPDLTYVISGERMAQLDRMFVSGGGMVRQLSAGLRVRDGSCVESRRRYMSLRDIEREMVSGRSPCHMVVFILNGVPVRNGKEIITHFKASEYESVEYVPPIRAGQLYGMEAAANGAIVLWSRGFGPHRSDERNPDGG